MEVKKKLKNFLKHSGIVLNVVLSLTLVLGLQMICCPICLADEPNYNDFDIPLEFWQALIDYNDEVMPLIFQSTAQNIKDYYDNTIKSMLITDFKAYDSNIIDQNLIFLLGRDTLSNGNTVNQVYILINNNTIGNVNNRTSLTINNDNYYNYRLDGPYICIEAIKVISTGNVVFSYTRQSRSSYYTTLTVTNPPFNTSQIDNETLNNTRYFGVNKKPLNVINTTIYGISKTYFINGFYPINVSIEPEPEEPSGESSSGESGDSGENNTNFIDYTNQLNNIDNNITNSTNNIINNQNQNTQTIVNTISGEIANVNNTLTESADETIDNTIITSGDIANTIDFSPINNNQEYTAITNFWYELLNSFSNALTSSNRFINIEFRGQIYTINLDDFTLNLPAPLKVFLASFTTAFVVIYISKNIKHITEDIQTASIDNVASKLTEDFETNLF